MGEFLKPLKVEFVDGNYWRLTRSLTYITNKNEIITAPRGFVTDFASVPVVARMFIPKSGEYDPAAVIHDWLYFKKDRPRNVCDGLFCDAMKDLGVNYVKASTMYYALRAFGWIAWKWGKDKYNAEFR